MKADRQAPYKNKLINHQPIVLKGYESIFNGKVLIFNPDYANIILKPFVTRLSFTVFGSKTDKKEQPQYILQYIVPKKRKNERIEVKLKRINRS